MKRFWQTCLAVVATAAITSSANAQWNESAEIGSYQSILSRAGYGNAGANGTLAGYNPAQAVPAPPGAAMAAQNGVVVQSGAVGSGCSTVNCGGGINYGASNCGCGGACDGSCGGGRAIGGRVMRGGNSASGTCGGETYLDYDNGAGGCGDAVYTPSNGISGRLAQLGGGIGGGSDSNMVASVFGLSFRRTYEDNTRLGYNGAGTQLYSNDLEHGNISGLGAAIAKRGCDGTGWEAKFWGLDEEDDLSLAGPTYTHLNGLSAVAHPPSGFTVADIYNSGTDARLYRDTDIVNFEFNMLRNGGQYTTRSGKSGNYELLGGFRLFKFDESLRYVSNSGGAYPATIEYALEAENTLLGFQLGGRNEICISDRLRFAHSGTAGIFNNRAETRQRIFDDTAYVAMDYMDTKDDAAFMGEIDLGLIYQFSQKARIRAGYRAMGVAGVALAADQIPYDFTNVRALTTANTNGSLILHGFYFGSEFCF